MVSKKKFKSRILYLANFPLLLSFHESNILIKISFLPYFKKSPKRMDFTYKKSKQEIPSATLLVVSFQLFGANQVNLSVGISLPMPPWKIVLPPASFEENKLTPAQGTGKNAYPRRKLTNLAWEMDCESCGNQNVVQSIL